MWEQVPQLDENTKLYAVGRTTKVPFFLKEREAKVVAIPPAVSAILAEGNVQLGEWYTPARGANAEYHSLCLQASRTKSVPRISEEKVLAAIKEVVQYYPRTKVSLEDCLSYNSIVSALNAVNMSASPGYPYGKLYATNKDLFENPWAIQKVIECVKWRVRLLSQLDLKQAQALLTDDLGWAIKHGLCDPMRVFVKDEPHKATKARDGRWRLIWSLSITDQIVERVLYQVQDSREIRDWPEIPSKSGMGLDDAGVDKLLQYAEDMKLNMSTDVEAWDFNAPDQIIRADAEARIMLNDAQDPFWENAVRAQYLLHSHRIVMLSDGRCFRRQILGGQASGRKVTSSSNGRCRCIVEAIIAQELGYKPCFMTQGDDAVTRVPHTLSSEKVVRQAELLFGLKLTDVNHRKVSTEIDFCSQTMRRLPDGSVLCIPEKPQKQFAKLLTSARKPDRHAAVDSLIVNLRHHPDLATYSRAAVAIA